MNYRKTVRRLALLSLFAMGGLTIQAQSVTKEFKATPLNSVLKEVEKQTGFSIMYNNDDLNGSHTVTYTFKDASIEEVLKAVLPKNLEFKLQNKMIVISRKDSQNTQQKPVKNITGVIVDAKGEPVIGANVVVKGTTNGVITDIDGNYTLNDVPTDAVISISYIGYQPQEFKANSKTLAKVVLTEDSEMLDEVVVVGYGVQRKRDVTTAISSMKASELAVPVSSVDQAIVGKMTGVQVTQPNGIPGGGFTIKVRGSGSITAGTDPLYVVDGFPMSSDAGSGTGQNVSPLSTINMNDIESIEVLKDASAAAIYGSRGANGVVIITTKKGKEGKDMKPTVQYDGYVGFQQRTKK